MSYQSKHTGAAIDAGIDAANAALPKSGGTMTGALILNANPTSNLDAVTKQYVDDAVGNVALTPGRDGKSAYQIALEHGFEGSEEEWLASLKGEDGVIGKDGEPGEDGVSPSVEVEAISGGHKVTITDATGPKSFEVMNGESGEDGENGISPTVVVEPISGGHRVSVTDMNGTQTFDVMNGANGSGGDGSGDMSMSVYDTNGNGVVDDSEKLGGKTPDQYASADHTHSEYADAKHTHTEYADADHTHDEYLTSYTETDPTVPAWAKAASKPKYTASEVGLGNVANVKQYSASNPPPYPVTSVNGRTGDVVIESGVSYSTAETLTGDTWIDGKPIYMRTFTGNSGANKAGKAIGNIPDLDMVVDFRGSVTVADYDLIEPIPSYRASTNALWHGVYILTTTKNVSVASSFSEGAFFRVTVYYTKTTD